MTSPRKLAQHGDRKKGDGNDDDGGSDGDDDDVDDERAALAAAIDLRESDPGHRTFVFSRFALLRNEHATPRAHMHTRVCSAQSGRQKYRSRLHGNIP